MMAASWRLQSVRQQRTTWWATIFYGSIHAFSVCHGFWPQAARHTHFLMNHSGRKSIKIFSDRNTIQLWKASHTSFYILSVYTGYAKEIFWIEVIFFRPQFLRNSIILKNMNYGTLHMTICWAQGSRKWTGSGSGLGWKESKVYSFKIRTPNQLPVGLCPLVNSYQI